MSQIASNLQIDSDRLWDSIHETAIFDTMPLWRDTLAMLSAIVLALAKVAS